MKILQYIAKHGHERIGGVSTISKKAIDLANGEESAFIKMVEKKIRESGKRLIKEAIADEGRYFEWLDQKLKSKVK